MYGTTCSHSSSGYNSPNNSTQGRSQTDNGTFLHSCRRMRAYSTWLFESEGRGPRLRGRCRADWNAMRPTLAVNTSVQDVWFINLRYTISRCTTDSRQYADGPQKKLLKLTGAPHLSDVFRAEHGSHPAPKIPSRRQQHFDPKAGLSSMI